MASGDKLIVTGDSVNLRAGPSTDAAVVGLYPKGTRVTEIGVRDDWTEVSLGAAAKGFMASRDLGPAPADEYLGRVALEAVLPMFPGTPRGNIETNLPFVAGGLRQLQLDDRDMLLMALGTIRPETASFRPIPEGQSKYNTAPGGTPFGLYDPGTRLGKNLGNTQAGDGARFKGRGYVQLTGRDNYTRIGKQLGVDLARDPDLGCDGTVAGLILAQFLKNNAAKIRSALAADDLKTARKLVNGGSLGLEDFTDAYRIGTRTLPA